MPEPLMKLVEEWRNAARLATVYSDDSILAEAGCLSANADELEAALKAWAAVMLRVEKGGYVPAWRDILGVRDDKET